MKNIKPIHKAIILLSLLIFLFVVPSYAETRSVSDRGIKVTARTSEGKKIPLYRGSYALIVGNGSYTNGWDVLPGALSDVKEVAEALDRNGFEVKLHRNLTKDGFSRVFVEFCQAYGMNEDNRILFYYAGHGHTKKMTTGENLGYIVMVDAPLPEEEPVMFELSSIDMQVIVTRAKMIKARHALFMFDSCFSGSILNLRQRVVPSNISENISLPVRQFITAGRANEPVPDHSVFKQSFLNLIEGRAKEPIPDGYITGEELGLYLKTNVPEYNSKQHPQYGKIRDPKLDQGDFVFVVGGRTPSFDKNGKLYVETNPSGAIVWVDGKRIGKTPTILDGLGPGQIKIRAAVEGYESKEAFAEIQPGKDAKITLTLNRIVKKGSLVVKSGPPNAEWFLDGVYVGTTPDEMTNIEQGDYLVEVKKKGYRDWSKSVEIDPGEQSIVHAELVRKGPESGEVWKEHITGMRFVFVPGRCFEMGADKNEKQTVIENVGDEKFYGCEFPKHEVCIDDFWIGMHEVTRGQFRSFIEEMGYRTDADKKGYSWIWACGKEKGEWEKMEGYNWQNTGFKQDDMHPVVNVSWNDAKAMAKWLSSKNKKRFRLPTEAEWEYACRAGARGDRFWGDNPDDACKYANVHDWTSNQVNGFIWTEHECDDYYANTSPVGNFNPNDFGLYDMLGNVYEWCEDRYEKDYYSRSPRHNPNGPSFGKFRVLRGGSWLSEPWYVRCSNRSWWDHPSSQAANEGFRLLLVPSQ